MHLTPQRKAQQSPSNHFPAQESQGNAVIARKAFEDNRPEAIAQRKIQSGLQSSPQVQAAAQLQANANQSAPATSQGKNETGMPDQLKAGIEGMSGMDMSDVRVHHGSEKPAQVQAHAYAQGNDIHLAPGQEQHLAHEAWHVVQQRQGRVQPTKQLKGKVAVNDDAGLEREADVMGAKAMQMKATDAATPNEGLQGGSAQKGNGPVQRMKSGGEEKIEEIKTEKEEEDKWVFHYIKDLNDVNNLVVPKLKKFYSNKKGTCNTQTEAAFHELLYKFRLEDKQRGAAILRWAEARGTDNYDVGDHTAMTIKIKEGVYVIDTTIDQFGCDLGIYVAPLETWKSTVLSLNGMHGEISDVDCKTQLIPIDGDSMSHDTMNMKARLGPETISEPEAIKESQIETKPVNPSKKKTCEIL